MLNCITKNKLSMLIQFPYKKMTLYVVIFLMIFYSSYFSINNDKSVKIFLSENTTIKNTFVSIVNRNLNETNITQYSFYFNSYFCFFLFCLISASVLQWIVSYPTTYKIPISVIWFSFGIIMGVIIEVLHDKDLTKSDALLYGLHLIGKLNPEVVYYVFLPVLLYEAAININWHKFKQFIYLILTLAILGVLYCVVTMGILIKYTFPTNESIFGVNFDKNEWSNCFLISACLASTDPIAVISILNNLNAPSKLASIFEGESLINDGSAVLLFQFFKTMATGSFETVYDIIQQIVLLLLVGPIWGFVIGVVIHFWIRFYRHYTEIKSLTLLAVGYAVYYIGEKYIKTSGPVSIVTYGLYYRAVGHISLDIGAQKNHHHTIEGLSTLANSSIFIIAGIIAIRMILETLTTKNGLPIYTVWHLPVLYLYVNLTRLTFFIAMYYFLKNRFGINWKEISLLVWGGLRGAIVLALGLMIEEDINILPMHRYRCLFYISGVTLLLLVLNGISFQFIYLFLNPYPPKPFRRVYLEKVMKLIDEQYQQEQSLLKNYWLFKKNNILDIADATIPRLGWRSMDKRGKLSYTLPHIPNALSKIPTEYMSHHSTATTANDTVTTGFQDDIHLDEQFQRDSDKISEHTKDKTDLDTSVKVEITPVHIAEHITHKQITKQHPNQMEKKARNAAVILQGLREQPLTSVTFDATNNLKLIDGTPEDTDQQSGKDIPFIGHVFDSKPIHSSGSSRNQYRHVLSPKSSKATNENVDFPVILNEDDNSFFPQFHFNSSTPTPKIDLASFSYKDNVSVDSYLKKSDHKKPLFPDNIIQNRKSNNGDNIVSLIAKRSSILHNKKKEDTFQRSENQTKSRVEHTKLMKVAPPSDSEQRSESYIPPHHHILNFSNTKSSKLRIHDFHNQDSYMFEQKQTNMSSSTLDMNHHLKDMQQEDYNNAEFDQEQSKYMQYFPPPSTHNEGILSKAYGFFTNLMKPTKQNPSIEKKQKLSLNSPIQCYESSDYTEDARNTMHEKSIPRIVSAPVVQSNYIVNQLKKKGHYIGKIKSNMIHSKLSSKPNTFSKHSLSHVLQKEREGELYIMVFNAIRQMYHRMYKQQLIRGGSMLSLCSTLDHSIDFSIGKLKKSPIKVWKDALKADTSPVFWEFSKEKMDLKSMTGFEFEWKVLVQKLQISHQRHNNFIKFINKFIKSPKLEAAITFRVVFSTLQQISAYVDVHEELLWRGGVSLRTLLGFHLLKSYKKQIKNAKKFIVEVEKEFPFGYPYALAIHSASLLINLKEQLVHEQEQKGLIMEEDSENLKNLFREQRINISSYKPGLLKFVSLKR